MIALIETKKSIDSRNEMIYDIGENFKAKDASRNEWERKKQNKKPLDHMLSFGNRKTYIFVILDSKFTCNEVNTTKQTSSNEKTAEIGSTLQI